jgi:hypothetical protein
VGICSCLRTFYPLCGGLTVPDTFMLRGVRDCSVHHLADLEGPFAPFVAMTNPGKNAGIAVIDVF